jgi:DNA-binding transcriptional regulator YiaG
MTDVRAYVPNIRLQQHRARLDLTQEAVAEELARLAWVHHGVRVGINADMVGKWERGEKRPSKLYRRLLCLLYQATEEALGFRSPVGAAQIAVPGSEVNRRDFLRLNARMRPVRWGSLVSSLPQSVAGGLSSDVRPRRAVRPGSRRGLIGACLVPN